MMKYFKDYSAEIEKMEELPDCRVTIPGEGMWGKKLPDGNIIINNVPLNTGYRYKDVVSPKEYGMDGERKIIFRFFLGQVWFKYQPKKTETEDRELRKSFVKALEGIGEPGFALPGYGYLNCRTNDQNLQEKLMEAVKAANLEVVEVEATSDTLPDDHPQKKPPMVN